MRGDEEEEEEEERSGFYWREEEEKIEGRRWGIDECTESVSDHQQGKHGLSHVESVSPVVVGDPPVAFTQRVHEPHQGLQNTHMVFHF